jgi:hypothetical protein
MPLQWGMHGQQLSDALFAAQSVLMLTAATIATWCLAQKFQ